MKRLCLSAILLTVSPAIMAQTPLESLHAATPIDSAIYTYDLQIDDGDMRVTASVNPSAPMGDRLTIHSPAPDTWSKDFAKYVKSMQENTKGNIWCQQFVEMVPSTAKLVSETDTTARYTFQPLPRPDDKGNMKKVLKHLTGRMTIDKTNNAVKSFEMEAAKPFKPMIAAKITQFKMRTNCTPAPNGQMRIETVETFIEGKAMTRSFIEAETQTISNLKRVAD